MILPRTLSQIQATTRERLLRSVAQKEWDLHYQPSYRAHGTIHTHRFTPCAVYPLLQIEAGTTPVPIEKDHGGADV